MEEAKLNVALLSSPGMGHLTPVLLLGRRLVARHDINVTILAVTAQTAAAESQLLTAKDDVPIIKILAPDITGLVKPDAKIAERIIVMMREARPGIRSAIMSMHPRPDVLMADFFSSEAWSIAEEFNMPKYIYVTSTAWFVALNTYCQELDKVVEGQYVDRKEPLNIPGCQAVRPEDVMDSMLDRNKQGYKEFLKQGINLSNWDGILINTWEDLEGRSLNALRTNESLRSLVTNPVYAIGPVCRQEDEDDSLSHELIKWLNVQPSESVLYVSFGSGGALSEKQIKELAWGLEKSKQRFVWVVRPPAGGKANGANGSSFFTAGTCNERTPNYLPEGFLARTNKFGLVVTSWAPQVTILNHPALGGFLTHCGWNSTLESILGGVPMIAWPLYAEQRLNATMLSEDLKVAVKPKVLPTKEVLERDEIESMVRRLMQSDEGNAMREKVKALRNSAKKSLAIGGSSHNAMIDVINECQAKTKSFKTIDRK